MTEYLLRTDDEAPFHRRLYADNLSAALFLGKHDNPRHTAIRYLDHDRTMHTQDGDLLAYLRIVSIPYLEPGSDYIPSTCVSLLIPAKHPEQMYLCSNNYPLKLSDGPLGDVPHLTPEYLQIAMSLAWKNPGICLHGVESFPEGNTQVICAWPPEVVFK